MTRKSTGPNRAYAALGLKFFFLIILLFGCDNGDVRAPYALTKDTGALAFQAVWPRPEGDNARMASENTANTPDVCATFGIETITASVVDTDGAEQGTGNWPCDTPGHTGTIGGLPVGAGYQLTVKGLIGNQEAWHGRTSNITINPGLTTAVEKITMYSLDFVLTALCSDGGRIDPPGPVNASEISVQTFNFIARTGYEVDEVMLDGVSIGFPESYTFSDIDAHHTLYVSFRPTGNTVATHTITATAGAGGAILPPGAVEVVAGNDQIFTFQPAQGNHVVDVLVDGVSQGALTSYTFTDVTADHTLRAVFNTTSHTITPTAGPGGSIDPPGPVTVSYGSPQSFNITANEGFYLAALRIDGMEVQPQSTYTFSPVTDDATIEASFKPVRYVDAVAQAGGSGTTWQSAFQSLGDAIQAAADGDEIWIKAGTYPLSTQISVNKAVAVYGGHSGSERFAHERNWQDNPTIFDGRNTTRGFYVTADALIDGVTVQNCSLSDSMHGVEGGGMFIDRCSPTLVNCSFLDNRLSGESCIGAAAYAYEAAPEFRNCRFDGNTFSCESSKAGAIYLEASSTTISDSVFTGNAPRGTEALGGSLVVTGGDAVITGSRFIGNLVDGSYVVKGGAIWSHNADLTLSGCLFTGNRSMGSISYGGAVAFGSGLENAILAIENSIFLDNFAGHDRWCTDSHGGALFNENAEPSILNCTFSGNSTLARSTSRGGAIANVSGHPSITNSILWGNLARITDGMTISNGEGMQLHDDADSGSTVSYSVVHGSVPNGDNNLDQAPLLDPSGHLQPGSAGLDAGDDTAAPDMDIDGELRPQNGRSDIGADELVDADSDQMADYWERRHGLDTASDDSGLDADSDGLTNLAEYRMGLNPTRANPWAAAVHRGWYDHNGFHDAADNGTRCGFYNGIAYRAYFTFDLPAVAGTVKGAILRLELQSFQSIEQSEHFSVNEVTTDPMVLEASASGQTAIFDDLGDGIAYAAEATVTPADVGRTVGITLSAEAVTEITASAGGAFSVGIENISADGSSATEFITFSNASEPRTHQLILIVEE